MYHKLPITPPGDLHETHQDDDARQFLQETSESATLAFENLPYDSREFKGCGAFARLVRWRLKNAHTGTNGFIVQKITNQIEIADAAGKKYIEVNRYWEAWKVAEGHIIQGPLRYLLFLGGHPLTAGVAEYIAGDCDLFGMGQSPNTRGFKKKEGWAKFMLYYEAPERWGAQAVREGASDSQPSTLTEPGWPWSEKDTLYRWYQLEYDGCNGKQESKFTSFDGDNRANIDR
jgi:hypothetical protein